MFGDIYERIRYFNSVYVIFVSKFDFQIRMTMRSKVYLKLTLTGPLCQSLMQQDRQKVSIPRSRDSSQFDHDLGLR